MRVERGFETGLVFFLIIAGTFGCLPQGQREVIGPKPSMITPRVLPIPSIEERVIHLEGLLRSGELAEEERKTVSKLLEGYNTVSVLLQNHPDDEEYRQAVEILVENLTDLEAKYLLKIESEKNSQTKAIQFFSSKRKMLMDDYLSGDYQAVINHALELQDALGTDALTPEIGLVFADSLAKRGMVDEALRIGEKILRELEGRPDLVHLRARLIEWRLALGQRERAIETYEKLIDDLNERKSIFSDIERRLLQKEERLTVFDNDREEKPATLVTETEVPDPLQELLGKVDRLVGEQQFQAAKLLLLRQRIRAQEESEIQTLDQALKSVEQAEVSVQTVKTKGVSPENEDFQLARNLIEQEKYEEAITRLDGIQGDQEMMKEVVALRADTVEKLIHRERNRAAKFFLMARSTTDPVKKETYLTSSQKILQFLIEKYPSSDLLERLRDNLLKVEEELEKTS